MTEGGKVNNHLFCYQAAKNTGNVGYFPFAEIYSEQNSNLFFDIVWINSHRNQAIKDWVLA
jgi:hypothetical protein